MSWNEEIKSLNNSTIHACVANEFIQKETSNTKRCIFIRTMELNNEKGFWIHRHTHTHPNLDSKCNNFELLTCHPIIFLLLLPFFALVDELSEFTVKYQNICNSVTEKSKGRTKTREFSFIYILYVSIWLFANNRKRRRKKSIYTKQETLLKIKKRVNCTTIT